MYNPSAAIDIDTIFFVFKVLHVFDLNAPATSTERPPLSDLTNQSFRPNGADTNDNYLGFLHGICGKSWNSESIVWKTLARDISFLQISQ
ncbi:hypothetical protein DCAR_0414992 [Daucus carota subsp. sativus]|uniref:Uncharacterized protein n=1 Tax=Daucus carota subsp. sativus TaxID=79200 RepID=A0A165A4W8_DAUCS|nr:hypothetical protein DCAR_0414992 [Daucus carota subsp. sativus]